MKLNAGWKEVFGAIGICVSIAVAILILMWLLSGCSGFSAAVKVNHDSSAQDVHDTCENNTIGPDLRWYLGKNCGKYCPEMTLGLGWDVRGTPCQGRDPVGNASFRFPIWVK